MSAEQDPRDDNGLSAVKAAAILGAIFTVAAAGLYGARAALSVAVGAGIAVANLLMLRAIIRALIRGPEEPPKDSAGDEPDEKSSQDHAEIGRRGGVAWAVFAVLKIFLLFGGVWILLTRGLVAPIPLVVGYGVLPLGIAAASLWSSLGPRR
jgi:dipeptide/tripeptide permease